ncbi:MAG: CU044_2847 family protein [Candidatus Hatepunaea meridiana]|nr:CU044_2847 family protein [Candidatus Hatepunaea meridiana]
MPTFTINPNDPVLIEFETERGVRQAAGRPDDLSEKSEKALEKSMNTIHNMADRMVHAVSDLKLKPSSFELAFGIKLTAETGALIAKAGGEANFNVKLTWNNQDA